MSILFKKRSWTLVDLLLDYNVQVEVLQHFPASTHLIMILEVETLCFSSKSPALSPSIRKKIVSVSNSSISNPSPSLCQRYHRLRKPLFLFLYGAQLLQLCSDEVSQPNSIPLPLHRRSQRDRVGAIHDLVRYIAEFL
jgi:hypothetical protein